MIAEIDYAKTAVCPQTTDANREMQPQPNPDSLESSMNFGITRHSSFLRQECQRAREMAWKKENVANA